MQSERDQLRLFDEPVPVSRRNAAIEASRKAFPEELPTVHAARRFLSQVIIPPSMRWGFISVGKNASTSTLRFLFQAEFGCDLTVDVTPLHDINPSASVHMIADHDVFSRALLRGMAAQELSGPQGPEERVCIVRNPLSRAVSAYRYLCKSHHMASRWFARDRFRMNAVTGFDWGHHTDTEEGFVRFLDYVAWQVNTEGADKVNAHWCPQASFIKPTVFKPTIIGKMEDLDHFFRMLSSRLGTPPTDTAPWENRQSGRADALLECPRARARCEEIYAEDYGTFGY
ncbi:MAG: sulfotransferase family 2 domain-containing protein [Ruegeria sp.]|uniref:sulfotransferase family 2 domain-containing protein n=1 Tax=Ruegeria sp. TaxID=1879320 RepID=UPI00349EC762